jgi:hypothetical protein
MPSWHGPGKTLPFRFVYVFLRVEVRSLTLRKGSEERKRSVLEQGAEEDI